MYNTEILDRIIAYEAGQLEPDDIAQLMVDLANGGTLASLQGHYHRTFKAYVDARHIIREANTWKVNDD